jgi:hypothetical protein
MNKTIEDTDKKNEDSQIESYTYTLHFKTTETGLYKHNKATTQNYNTRLQRRFGK